MENTRAQGWAAQFLQLLFLLHFLLEGAGGNPGAWSTGGGRRVDPLPLWSATTATDVPIFRKEGVLISSGEPNPTFPSRTISAQSFVHQTHFLLSFLSMRHVRDAGMQDLPSCKRS